MTALNRPLRELPARALAAMGVVLGLVGALILFAPSPAQAHDQLIASTPGTQENLSAAPEEVSLTFSDSVLTVGAKVLVTDSAETDWLDGEPTLEGTNVIARIKPELPAGHYTVKWRVVSSDGHPISGLIPFSVGDAGAAPRASVPATSPESEEPAPTAEKPSEDNALAVGSPLRTIGIGVGGAVVAAAIVLLVMRSKRRSNSSPS